MSSRSRKYECGNEKHKRKRRLEQFARTQKGALDRFVVKECQTSTQDQTPQADSDANNDDNTNNVEAHTPEIDSVQANPNNADGVDVTLNGSASIESDNDLRVFFQPNIVDPRYWDGLEIDILIEKGPKRDLSIQKGPKYRLNRRFSATLYTRPLTNGETSDREWLVYSKELDRVLCFYCKLLKKGHLKSQLANDGLDDWSHVSIRLKDDESSADHITNMADWYDMRLGFDNNQTIDEVAQREIEKEKDHWRKVLFRIILIVKFLANPWH